MMNETAPELRDEPDWQVQWGGLLRTARQVAGLSLSELADVTGLSKGYLSKLESGHVAALNPSRATLAALARALPSFRALAHTLEPARMAGLTFAEPVPEVPQLVMSEADAVAETPIRLGWRELEVLVAVLTLERAAVLQPLTVVLIARATGRPGATVRPVLEALERMGVLAGHPPARFGGASTYTTAADFEAHVGIRQIGDALVLAAALLAQGPLPRRRGHGLADN